MADKNALMIDLDDERAEKIAEVITNKTCKKILSALAEKEMSESEISSELGIPLNTVGYNIDKLIGAGLIEKAEKSFWSVKGKKVHSYRVSNKRIVISPKRKLVRGVLPAVLVAGLAAIGIKIWEITDAARLSEVGESAGDASGAMLTSIQNVSDSAIASVAGEKVMSGAVNNVSDVANLTQPYAGIALAGNYWLWFIFGAIVALGIFILWNWRQEK
jgi:DNA-binding transcriptional ArsR family regulator